MAELPFGDNPFKKPTQTSGADVNKAAPSAVPVSKAPPLLINPRHKRKNIVIAGDPGKGEVTKKNKVVQSDTSSAASLIFSDISKENFKDEDVIGWSKRGKSEATFCFKQALGESFFHSLELVNSMESENLKLQQALSNAKASSDYYKGLLDGAEKKVEELGESHKLELNNLQGEVDRLKSEVVTANEARDKEVDKLNSEKASILEGKDKELSDAFSLGFKAYLENFLAADPDYNWALHFPPSTPAYMVQFKTANAAAIEKAKATLEVRIAKEMEAKTQGDAKQKRQEDENEESHVASPSQTVGT